jgi:hypothetical protein
MIQLVQDAKLLIQTAQESYEGCESDLYGFLIQFERIMHGVWEAAETVSEAHASVASELLDISRIYLAGERQLHPAQLESLANVVDLLTRDQLTMAAAAEADRYLLTHGLDAFFPVHGDLVALYQH